MRLRRNYEKRGLRTLTSVSRVMLVLLALFIGVLGLGISIGYAELQRGLPGVDELQAVFSSSGSELPAPTRFYDRTGEIAIQELLHPLAAERTWFHLPSDPDAYDFQSIVSATVAAQDASFWSNPGFQLGEVFHVLTADPGENGVGYENASISQQLAQYFLQPLQDASIDPLARYLRSVLLASRLNDAYAKEQILEWYLNSAYYGNLAFGIDAAALVYFGVHASDLSLAQAAMLAPIVQNPELNPIDSPQEAGDRQAETLREMARLGYIEEQEQQLALRATLDIRGSEEVRDGLRTSGFNAYTWKQLLALMGPQLAYRPGLQVRTSLDLEMQLQADCTAHSYLARMRGENPALVLPALDGSGCTAAVSLPPLRPGDIGLDHRISDISVVIIDPFTGEILSLVDTQGTFSLQSSHAVVADRDRDLGTAFYPFIYLTAFSRGFAPGTMVLDLPAEASVALVGDSMLPPIDWHDYNGPVRMRTALVGSYEAAAERTLDLVGVGNVLHNTRQMGISSVDAPEVDNQLLLSQGEAEANLIDMTFAYALMSNSGSMVGVALTGSDQANGPGALDPIAILLVEDALGNEIFTVEPEVRVVLSPQLAYLMTDMLTDEVARWGVHGQSSPLEIGRPAGVMVGTTHEASDNWTIGFTPARAIGVWVGNTDESMVGVSTLNGAAPLWHALMRYSTQDLPLQGWSIPPGVTEMEVCDPSGLLPTLYCPDTVREVFVHGTEPTSYDHLYRPFRVNRETGNLATLFTPLDLVEERVYLVPPPEAMEWARQVGIEQPPQEYDSIYVQPEIDPAVNITSLEPFAYASGELLIEGNAHPEGFVYYRLQYGAGINPTRWIQIDEDIDEEVHDGILGLWDTEGLNGLFTLQLVVVREGDRVDTAAIPVTIDSMPPLVQLIEPQSGQEFSRAEDEEVIIEIEASDETGLSQVAFYVDGRRFRVVDALPYSASWTIANVGEHTLFVRVYDLAGNSTQSDGVTIVVVP
jgi:membrane carboxypeptidase/penicillin-binding protein